MTRLLSTASRGLAALILSLASPLSSAVEIVDAAYVQAALARGAIVWDVRDAASYKDGHIPGAVNAGELGTVLRDPNREDWLPTAQVQAVLGRAGIDPIQREVIVYSRTGDPNAYRALAGLRYFGAASAKVFHGGLDAWQAADKPVAKEPTVLQPVALTLSPAATGEVLWTPAMIERVKARGAQIVDARTPKEFAGEDVRAIRGGHIPGAVNLPFEDNWADPQTGAKLASKQASTRAGMSLKPTDELRKLYAGLDREREVFVNVGALNGRLAALQGRVGELENELVRVKTAR